MNCLECGAAMKVERGPYKAKEIGLPGIVLLNVEQRRCARCGETEVVIPHLDGLHRTIAGLLIRKPGGFTGAEVRFLRKFVGWSEEDFAGFAGVRRETISRWENGHEPIGPQSDAFLRAYVAHGKRIDDYQAHDFGAAGKGRPVPLKLKLEPVPRGWAAAAPPTAHAVGHNITPPAGAPDNLCAVAVRRLPFNS